MENEEIKYLDGSELPFNNIFKFFMLVLDEIDKDFFGTDYFISTINSKNDPDQVLSVLLLIFHKVRIHSELNRAIIDFKFSYEANMLTYQFIYTEFELVFKLNLLKTTGSILINRILSTASI